MKKFYTLLTIAAGTMMFVACGPSAAELEAEKKRVEDSTIAAQAEQARLDSIAAAEAAAAADAARLDSLRQDSIAKAEAAAAEAAAKKGSKKAAPKAAEKKAETPKESKMSSGGSEAAKQELIDKKKSKMGTGK